MADENSNIGRHIGNYRLVAELGSGGFAEVYLAQHLYLTDKPPVAIKLLHARLQAKEREQFIQEAQLLYRLQHLHILPLLDAGFQDGTPYIVMEYASQGSLQDRLNRRRGQPFPVDEAMTILTQIGEAMQYAHQQHIVHRDLKPDNILFNARDEALLADFGIAVILSSSGTKKAGDAGTPAYMAPEMFEGKVSPKSDQYALGCIAYELVTGHKPFEVEGVPLIAVQYQHAIVKPIAPTQHNSHIPAHIEQAILKAMAKDRVDRYDDILTFLKTLQAPIKEPISSSPTKEPEPPIEHQPNKKIFHRREVIVGLAGLAVVAAGGLTLWSFAKKPQLSSYSTSTPKITHSPTSIPRTATSTPLTYRGHVGVVFGLAWSPNGRYIASTGSDKTVQVWASEVNTNSLTPQFVGNLSGSGESVTWSPDGKYIATADDNDFISIWDWQTKNRVFSYNTHHQLRSVAWSPNSNYLAFGSISDVMQVLDVSDVSAGHIIKTYVGHTGSVNAVAWSPDNNYLVSGSKDKTVRVWNALTGDLIGIYTGHADEVYSVSWSSYEPNIVSSSCDATVQVWNAFTRNEEFNYNFPGPKLCVHTVNWSPDSGYIAAGSWNGKVEIWKSMQSDPVFTFSGNAGAILVVAWSPDGKRIASGCNDKVVQIWEVK